MESQFTKQHQLCCTGSCVPGIFLQEFLSIKEDSSTSEKDNTSHFQTLLDSIKEVVQSSKMHLDTIMSIRLFYHHSLMITHSKLVEILKQTLPHLPAYTFVPVEGLFHTEENNMVLQIMAYDLDKLETELWLRHL